MKKILILFLILFFLNACKAQKVSQIDCMNLNDTKSFIKNEIEDLKKINKIVDSKVLKKISNDFLTIFLNKEAFALMRKIKIESKRDIIDFTSFFTKEDFNYMKCQLKSNKIKNWKQLVESNIFKKNDSIKKVLSKYKQKTDVYSDKKSLEILRLRKKLFYYSLPLFSKDLKHAILYRETLSSGSLFILKKINNEWIYYASSFVWISD